MLIYVEIGIKRAQNHLLQLRIISIFVKQHGQSLHIKIKL
jgi:hypothetical protein